MKIAHHQRGLTLVEVMISVTLGLLFLAAALNFLLSGQQSHTSQDTGTRIQENARFAMDILRENIRMTGYTENDLVTPAYIYTDPCGTSINGEDSSVSCSNDTTRAQGDRLALSMVSSNSQDCLGTDLGDNNYVANVFWVEQVATRSSLYCRGWDIDNRRWFSAAEPLVGGIDQMQVQYGLFNAVSGSVDRYLNATEVAGDQWNNVRSVRIALLINAGTDTDVKATFADNYDKFTLLDADEYDPTDKRIRRVFTGTVAINNFVIEE